MKRNYNHQTIIKRGILFAVLISIHILNVQGQNPGKAEAQVKASVTIISGLEINQKKNMHFGEIKVPEKGKATIELKPDGSISGDNSLLAGGSRQAAEFKISGEANAQYTFSVPEHNLKMKGATSGETLTLKNFTVDRNSSLSQQDGGTSYDIARVGGTLAVNSNQTPDDYSATFKVTANYQ